MISLNVENYLSTVDRRTNELFINREHFKLLAIHPSNWKNYFYVFLFNTLTNSKETIMVESCSAKDIIKKWNEKVNPEK